MQATVDRATLSLHAERVEIRHGRRITLARFDWLHEAGAIAWLIGENGNGKSSLLNIFAGSRAPASGTVTWRGGSIAELRYCTPSMAVPPDVRVGDWIDFIDALHGTSTVPPLVAELFPATTARSRRFGHLSTGEAKRLLLWAALRAESGPLILDEPYEHLSRTAKTALTRLLRQIAKSTVVIVATNQDVPLVPGEQLLVLDETVISVEQFL